MEFQSFDTDEEMQAALQNNSDAWDVRTEKWQQALTTGDCFLQYDPSSELFIYGEIDEMEYLEDRELFARPEMVNRRIARCYSPACPEGELGDNFHVGTVMLKLSRATFDAMRTAGWPQRYRAIITTALYAEGLVVRCPACDGTQFVPIFFAGALRRMLCQGCEGWGLVHPLKVLTRVETCG